MLGKTIKCAALWLVVDNKEEPKVLLKKWDKPSNTDKLYIPLFCEEWVRRCDNGSELTMLRREAGDLFGELFLQKNLTIKGYPFPRLLRVDAKEFTTGNKRQGVRLHYFGRITENQLKIIEERLQKLWSAPFPHVKKVRIATLTANDCCRMLKLGLEENIRKDSIILFPDDFDVIYPFLENDAEKMRLILEYDWP